ncbi:MAG TPA: hypothetical protein VKU81_07700, partial [Casimicrobiaceae bacterium]|nr:hypothetical protein [Casimicrobiaceae bacterium]
MVSPAGPSQGTDPAPSGGSERSERGGLVSAGDAAVDLDVEDLAAKAPPVAVRATQVHVGEELHLDVLEA